jgi:transcriptional regulator with XRE-family HTH domain
MITAAQMRAARALLGIDQRQLAVRSDVSLPTIQRMEASEANVRGVVETLTKVIAAFDAAGVELIGENVRSIGDGRGVRFKHAASVLDAFTGEKFFDRLSRSSSVSNHAADAERRGGSGLRLPGKEPGGSRKGRTL